MKISQAISSTLLVAITEAMQNGSIPEYGGFELPKGWQHETLTALGDDFARSLNNALDGTALVSFVRDQLTAIQLKAGEKFPEGGGRLTDMQCFSSPLDVARIIVKSLEQIPTQYRLIIPIASELAGLYAAKPVDIKLSDRLRILSGSKLPPTVKLSHDNEALDQHIKIFIPDSVALDITHDGLYIEYRTSGYFGMRRQSRAVSEFYDEVRAFYGACIAYNIIATFTQWGDQETPYVIGNSIKDNVEEFAYTERAEDDVVTCFNLATTLQTDGRAKNGDPIEDILSPIFPVFKSNNSDKLKTACAWALRAHLSNRGLDQILESAITIEVLMGDRDTSDRVGLSKLIANRCAYALGRSYKARADMIDFFVKFYRVRSEVVHSGRTALEPDERKIVNEGLDLATQILKHEIALS